jgi:hypothetical protein
MNMRHASKSFRLLVMTEEIDVLRIISERLQTAAVPFIYRYVEFERRKSVEFAVDRAYLKDWAAKLGVAAKLDEVSK